MAKTDKYSLPEVCKALIDSHGIVLNAAKKLGTTDQTIYNYLKKYRQVQDARERGRQILIDKAEDRLVDSVESGNMRSVEFVLRTLGRDRGYVERSEVAGSNDAPVKITLHRVEHRKRDNDE